MHACLDIRMDGWVDRFVVAKWMDACRIAWMDGWVDRFVVAGCKHAIP